MNLLEAKNYIFNFFKEKDILVLPDDFNKIILISENIELDIATIKEALKSFIEGGFVKLLEYEEGKKKKHGYVLEKPLQNYEQSLTISGETALYISRILNDLKDKDDQNFVNPLAINENNIESLIILITQLLKEYKKNQEKSDDYEEED